MNIFRQIRDFSWFVAIYVAIFVLPFAGVGGYEIYKIKLMHDNFVRTEATVVGNSYSMADDDEGGAYYPVVEFEIVSADSGGGKTRFTDGVGSLPPDYEVGERLTVIYDPGNPSRTARIYSWKRIWFVPILFMVIGLLPLAVPCGIFWLMNRGLKAKAARR